MDSLTSELLVSQLNKSMSILSTLIYTCTTVSNLLCYPVLGLLKPEYHLNVELKAAAIQESYHKDGDWKIVNAHDSD